ncbi:hypothetical protein FJ976_01615 [Mesorhizobium sp. B1-1-9]|uniref:hypothetical protein n=1 Tax=Mesorhizobium sp. B1-1-9 TaxID=2589975 RepID=UPI00112DEF75|nr:hypothetical protein [Mesorhizobium sp. B1-1-9]TPN58633.1 hypothetical protein FJ976_01615 [Mesorhizobium sp. B1-1-9]
MGSPWENYQAASAAQPAAGPWTKYPKSPDLARIKSNVAKMASQNAPVEDIDGYIASEGVTVDDVRNFKATSRFQFDTPQGKFEVEAPDQESAIGALKGMQAPQPDKAPIQSPPGPEAQQPQQTYGGALNTWLDNAISGIPIVGPAIKKGSDYLGTEAIGAVTGQDPAQMRADIEQRREQRDQTYPASSFSGKLGGSVAATGALGATVGGAQALGVTGESILGRILASGASNAAISGADTSARGGSPSEILGSMETGAGIGGAIPIVGAGLNAGLSAISDRVAPFVGSLISPAKEAERRVGSAIARDQAANPRNLVGPGDEAMAQQAGVPLLNADRGGETTRALARSVGNQSPEARATIENAANDRFGGQGSRAASFIRQLSGGSADDLAYQQAIRDSARAANKPAYNRAYAAPAAQNMWNSDFEQLMQAPAMQQAATGATTRGANRAAVEGFQPVRNPFQTTPDGKLTLRTNPDGSTALPTLQFWDQTKRNLDSMVGKAERSGDNTYAGDLKSLRGALVKMTDAAVPEYKTARQGAAAYFGAEDALDAGRKFVNSQRSIPEAQAAFAKFSPAEKQAFQTGFASELIDKINSVGDRSNVITQVFKSPAARSQIDLVFGPQKAKQIEAYIRVEDLADKLRGAMGNSTTARQLVEMGIGAGAGYTFGGQDWKGATGGALLAAGARYGSKQIDQRVMQQVAKMLVSDNPKVIEAAVKQATASPTFMRALENLSDVLAVPARGGAVAAEQNNSSSGRSGSSQPLDLTARRAGQ